MKSPVFHVLPILLAINGTLTSEVQDWIQTLKDPLKNHEAFKEPLKEPLEPLIEIVSCDKPNATWAYKYVGSKGKRKIFSGKGKISFTKYSDPPHGFDYGMKSGHCLVKRDANLKSVEGEFNSQGVLQGQTKLDFFNGDQIQVQVLNGVQHGFQKFFQDEIDEETNMPKKEKALHSVQMVLNGEPVGAKWTFLLNNLTIYQKDDSQSILFVPQENG